ncbi:MAG: polysaccharide deacetylase family protein [Hyphomicrobiaceae bacterium]
MLRLLARTTSLMIAAALFSTAASAQTFRTSCPGNPGAVGVSRIVRIDATGGPRFGHLQYRDHDFLTRGEVVLTFDDGPAPGITDVILKALERHCTKATFFVVGRMAISHPLLLQDVARRGHTIGTHTWSHKYQLRRTNMRTAEHEIELGFSAVQAALGKPIAPFFRYPFLSDGRRSLEHLGARNVAVFSIDIDSLDYRSRNADAIIAKVMGELKRKGKGILLFHDIQPATARAMPRLLDELRRGGYRIVHIQPTKAATTLARHDSEAARLLSRKRIAQTRNPLAPRSMVWPMEPPARRAGAPLPPTAPGSQQPRVPVSAPQTAPVPPAPMVQPPGEPPRVRLRGPIVERSWKSQVLGGDGN